MKPRNFPARKMMRQIRAQMRADGRLTIRAEEQARIDAAREVRTKKNRASIRV